MSELILFTFNGILIYLLSDWILRRIEHNRGGVLPNRQVFFFVIFLFLALLSFTALRALLTPEVI